MAIDGGSSHLPIMAAFLCQAVSNRRNVRFETAPNQEHWKTQPQNWHLYLGPAQTRPVRGPLCLGVRCRRRPSPSGPRRTGENDDLSAWRDGHRKIDHERRPVFGDNSFQPTSMLSAGRSPILANRYSRSSASKSTPRSPYWVRMRSIIRRE